MIDAVVFDLDGVLIDSESVWAKAREELVRERGGSWHADATRAMMGMSSLEWSRYMHDELGVELPPAEISRQVVARLEQLYRERLPLLPGAVDAVRAMAERWPLGIASSANRPLIDLVVERAGWVGSFRAAVSSEEVAHGKPAPDVYLEAARRLDVPAARCAAVEDSSNGLRSAAAAGMTVVAIPNADFPPAREAVALADVVIRSIRDLSPAVLDGLSRCQR